MLRYKTGTRPGLVALYDIRPGNGAGPFLQPRSPPGASGRFVRNVCSANHNVSLTTGSQPVNGDRDKYCSIVWLRGGLHERSVNHLVKLMQRAISGTEVIALDLQFTGR